MGNIRWGAIKLARGQQFCILEDVFSGQRLLPSFSANKPISASDLASTFAWGFLFFFSGSAQLVCTFSLPPPLHSVLSILFFSRCVTTTSGALNRFQTNLFNGYVFFFFFFLLILEDFRSLRRLHGSCSVVTWVPSFENICPGSFVDSSPSWSSEPKWEMQLGQMFWTSSCLLGFKSWGLQIL